ncbi:MAG TPA: hypothetical protein VMY42_00395 [Thermoguttaceae bacterium]|nr:hypothetical protein [Thermoguttaceae bacterium]
MKIYEFTLIIPDVDDETADAIYEKCKDSSLGKCGGETYVAYDREAESLESAIDSAVADLRSLGIQPLRIQMEVSAASS